VMGFEGFAGFTGFVEPTTTTGIVAYLTVFVLAAFVGIEVVSKVPSILHTPLMSGSNAIHGIVLVGALVVMGEAHGTPQLVLGFLAVFLATLNVVGGFVVTDRMLEMFKAKPAERAKTATSTAKAEDADAASGSGAGSGTGTDGSGSPAGGPTSSGTGGAA
jgi:H+-translocating NAD(P) transhydrogenase subunit alpha